MISAITSKNPIFKSYPSGDPCHVTRVTLEPIPNKAGRVYTTITYESTKEEYQEVTLDENNAPISVTKTRTKLGNVINSKQEIFTIKEINDLTNLVKPLLPPNLTPWEIEVYKRLLALRHKTQNYKDLPNGFLNTKEWELDSKLKIY